MRRVILRIFGHRAPIVRLPRLPRQVIVIALSINIAALALIIPYLVSEWVNRNLRETVAQAAVLSQLTDMQEMAMGDTQALRFIGYERVVEKQARQEIIRNWLIIDPPQAPAPDLFDLTNAGVLNEMGNVTRILRAPREAVFAITDGPQAGLAANETVRVLTTYAMWQDYVKALLTRVGVTIIGVCLIFTLVFRVVFRRLMLQSLDDLFVRLYGSTVLKDGPADMEASGARDNLLASLDNFQHRMRRHVDEQARLASLGAGVSFLAHGLRNLLASLTLNAEQLSDMPGEKEQRIGRRLTAAIEQALSLVDWAALYTSDKRDNLQVDAQLLKPVIADALNFARLHDPNRRTALVNRCPENVHVVAEEKLMFRVIYNLVLNAMQAMKGQNGAQHVILDAQSDDEKCEIFITDSGPGLPGGQSGALLVPHIGLRPDGTGLGLKIVVDLLSWHGGRVDIEHSNARGTRFKITVPHKSPGAPRDEELALATGINERST